MITQFDKGVHLLNARILRHLSNEALFRLLNDNLSDRTVKLTVKKMQSSPIPARWI